MKKIIGFVIVYIIIWCGFGLAQTQTDDFFSCTTNAKYFDNYFFEQKHKIGDTADIINSFCEFVLSDTDEKPAKCYNNEYSRYTASESMFVNYLCKNTNSKYNEWYFTEVFSENSNVLKITNWEDLWYYTNWVDWTNECDPKKGMNECDVLWNNYDMFSKILNDYFNLIQSKLFAVEDVNWKIEDVVNEFSRSNFLGKELCGTNSKHPKTCKTMTDYIKQAKNLINNADIIDMEALGKITLNCEDMADDDYGLVYCALIGSDSLYEVHFINLVQNEVFWFENFNLFYQNMVLWEYYEKFVDEQYSNLRSDQKLLKVKEYITENKIKANDINKSITYSLSSVYEIANTFSYHVWLMMYQEDLYNLRKEFSKLYSPIVTLSSKLINVQDANS